MQLDTQVLVGIVQLPKERKIFDLMSDYISFEEDLRQESILKALDEEGGLSLEEIAEYLDLPESSLQMTLDSLVSQGEVEIETWDEDGKTYLAYTVSSRE